MAITVNTLLDELDGSIVDGDVSLRDALAAPAPADGIIDFDASLLDGQTILLTEGELVINKALTIDASSLDNGLTIDAQHNSRIFNIDDPAITTEDFDVTLVGLTLTGGRTTEDNDNVDQVNSGGAIRSVTSGHLTITDSIITNSYTQGYFSKGGGIFVLGGDVTLTGSSVSGNHTVGDISGGGGIFVENNLDVINSQVSGNYAIGNLSGGGGIVVRVGNLTLTDSTVSGNETRGYNAPGGGIITGYGDVTLTNSTVSGNHTVGDFSEGGGIFAGGGAGAISNVTLKGNSTVTGNYTEGYDSGGGGIYASGEVTLTNSTVSGNHVQEDGSEGGGIFTRGDVELISSSVTGNHTEGNDLVGGGGIFSYGIVTLTNSTVRGNYTQGDGKAGGGGVFAFDGAVITNSTISGNQTRGTSEGGGLFSYGNLFIHHSTITDNHAGTKGGGIWADNIRRPIAVTISNSIVAGNTADGGGPDLGLTVDALTVRYSLIGDNTDTLLVEAPIGFPDSSGNLIGQSVANGGSGIIDPLLGPPAGNGGQTLTHGLLPGSPAINAGDPNAEVGVDDVPEFDQRGEPFSRVHFGRLDMGAYEFTGPVPMNFVVDIADDELDGNFSGGDLSLREALWASNLDPEERTITFASNLDGDTILLLLGEMEITDVVTIDASSLPNGLTIDAQRNSRIFNIDDPAIATEDFDVTLTGLTLTGGRTTGDNADTDDTTFSGGAIRSLTTGDLTITDSTISGNYTQGNYADGGGIFTRGNVTLTNSTVSGNHTDGFRAAGGGIFTHGGASITNSTVSGNQTQSVRSDGGGIFSYGNLIIAHSTITGNHAGAPGGGVQVVNYIQPISVMISNSIVAGNTADGEAPADLAAQVVETLTVEHSLIGDNSGTSLVEAPIGFPDSSGNLIGQSIANGGSGIIDPLLAPLADNGGLTLTHTLLAGSPAINAGDPDAEAGVDDVPEFDQRGEPFGRANFSRLDMGAVEFDGPIPTNFVVDIADDEMDGDFSAGDLSLREALWASNLDPEVRTITFASNLDGDTILFLLGEMEITDVVTIDASSLPNGLTIDAQQQSRIFNITATTGDFELSGLTLTGGRTTGDNADTDDTTFSGGAIRSLTTGNLNIASSTISKNYTQGERASGGGIFTNGGVNMSNSVVSENYTEGDSAKGGGIRVSSSDLTLTNSIVSENHTEGLRGYGGGISASNVTIEGSTISGNYTEGEVAHGGGIETRGYFTITNSTVSGNRTEEGFASGGGIFAVISLSYNATLTNSTVSGNYTKGESADGGGIRSIMTSGSITVTNSTISGNYTKGESADGGGIIVAGNSNVNVIGSTITGNRAEAATAAVGGFESDGAITNSIVAGNTAGAGNPDLRPSTGTLTVRYSLIGDNTDTTLSEAPIGFPDADGNLIGDPTGSGIIDPMLGPLTDNGGPTLTHALLPGSRAIDAGDPDFDPNDIEPPLNYDQRGESFVRVYNGRVDMGAVEAGNFDPSIDTLSLSSPIDEGGTTTLSGTYSDPNALDTHVLDVDWDGDGSYDQTVVLTGGTFSIDSPAYLDDSPVPLNVGVRLRDDAGGQNTDSRSLMVSPVAPTLSISGPAEVDEGALYTLNLSSSDPGDDTIAQWTIDWGDEVEVISGNPTSVTHIYDGDASYEISATATDEDGTYAAGNTVSVTVNNVPPTLSISGPTEVDEGALYTLNLSSPDPGDDTITQWTIDWGDEVEVVSGNPTSVTHIYADDQASYEISASATDEDGTYAAGDTVSVTVNNVPPTLSISGPTEVDEGALYTLNLSSPDPGDDTITQWTIDWGDEVEVVSGNPTSVTHIYADDQASYEISASATDEDGTYAAGNTVSVTVNNFPPMLSLSGAANVNEAAVYTLNLSSFDTGTDTITGWTINWGDEEEVISGNPTSVTHTYADGQASYEISASATDEDGTYAASNTVSVTVNNVPPTLSISGAANVDEAAVYTLNLSSFDTGTDTISQWTIDWGDEVEVISGNPASVTHTYDGDASYEISARATDEDGTYAAGNTVSVTVNNVPPTLSISGAPNVIEGAAYTLNLSSFETGSDTIVQWTIDWGDEVEVISDNPASVTHTYDGDASYEISATATDEDGTYTAGNTVSVTVNNIPPTLSISGAANVAEGAAYTLNLSSFDTGADTITQWTINWGDEIEVFSGDPTSVSHTYADGQADYEVSASATDEDGTYAAGNTVSITVNNVPPTLSIRGTPNVIEGAAYTLNLSSFDTGTDTITQWTINWGDEIEVISGNPAHVSHTYTSGNASYLISATATDEDGTFVASQTVAVNVSVLPIDSGPEQGQTTTRTAGLTVQATEEGTTAPTVSPAQETAETLLLLVIPEPESPPAPVSYGSNGYRPMHHYYVMPVQYSSGGGGASPAAIDAALANDEVEQEILLESFLDFIDPEFLVVDLGDEPPAQLAPDSANADTAQGGAAKTNGQLVQRIRGGRPRVALGNSTRADAEGTMPAAEREVSEPASETVGDAVSPILGFVAHYWRRFFAVTGVLLLGGAVWKGRNAWFRAARRMRQR